MQRRSTGVGLPLPHRRTVLIHRLPPHEGWRGRQDREELTANPKQPHGDPKDRSWFMSLSLRFVDWQKSCPARRHGAACMGNAAVAGAAAAGAATAWGLGLIPRTSGRLFLRAMRPCSAVRARTQAWRDSRCSCGLGRAAPAGCWGVPRRLRPVRVVCLI